MSEWPGDPASVFSNAGPGANGLLDLVGQGCIPAPGTGHTTIADGLDMLARLMLEAETVLRDPGHVGVHPARHDACDKTSTPVAGSDPNPLQTLAREAASANGLMDMLDVAGHIGACTGAGDATDDGQLFALPQTPDVLRLFASDIDCARGRAATANLTRREHHLVSLDSAYCPERERAPDHEQDA
ncbi:TagK domain-containing protein [Cupriavidus consociatus]|uniref:TagK domain-containing protein n=1 Tax=Cupriavidus consociatus TaxID=2821357 RepID=UPI001AE252C9|nr:MULTISPECIES: TagK domain-containing protein [unclassified Cupriavidus]MBP0623601.1 TagK domain-containing protein [Cupriavidus sp. LEh25]MDK2660304.1 TagK domain-containing protein [Cupriavidus sp. LEh21]